MVDQEIPIIVVGAAGRMGRRLVALTEDTENLRLVGAVEYPGSEYIDQDAGRLAGCGDNQIRIVPDLAQCIREQAVIIDFSSPRGIEDRLRLARQKDCAYVLGTTGFSEEEKNRIRQLMEGGRFVFAYNFSVGINLLLTLAEKVARILGDDYDIEIVEMHHNQKVDAPSGTAEKLAEAVACGRNLNLAEAARHGRVGQVGKRSRQEIGIHALRGGDVVGDHTVIFATGGERIELTHRASSRDAFARGALRAAVFLAGAAPGEYDMRDILGLGKAL